MDPRLSRGLKSGLKSSELKEIVKFGTTQCINNYTLLRKIQDKNKNLRVSQETLNILWGTNKKLKGIQDNLVKFLKTKIALEDLGTEDPYKRTESWVHQHFCN